MVKEHVAGTVQSTPQRSQDEQVTSPLQDLSPTARRLNLEGRVGKKEPKGFALNLWKEREANAGKTEKANRRKSDIVRLESASYVSKSQFVTSPQLEQTGFDLESAASPNIKDYPTTTAVTSSPFLAQSPTFELPPTTNTLIRPNIKINTQLGPSEHEFDSIQSTATDSARPSLARTTSVASTDASTPEDMQPRDAALPQDTPTRKSSLKRRKTVTFDDAPDKIHVLPRVSLSPTGSSVYTVSPALEQYTDDEEEYVNDEDIEITPAVEPMGSPSKFNGRSLPAVPGYTLHNSTTRPLPTVPHYGMHKYEEDASVYEPELPVAGAKTLLHDALGISVETVEPIESSQTQDAVTAPFSSDSAEDSEDIPESGRFDFQDLAQMEEVNDALQKRLFHLTLNVPAAATKQEDSPVLDSAYDSLPVTGTSLRRQDSLSEADRIIPTSHVNETPKNSLFSIKESLLHEEEDIDTPSDDETVDAAQAELNAWLPEDFPTEHKKADVTPVLNIEEQVLLRDIPETAPVTEEEVVEEIKEVEVERPRTPEQQIQIQEERKTPALKSLSDFRPPSLVLPELCGLGDLGFDLGQYLSKEEAEPIKPGSDDFRKDPMRTHLPKTPEHPLRFFHSDTPSSVASSPGGIPLSEATIRPPKGSKLKVRPSLTPADVSAMAAARREAEAMLKEEVISSTSSEDGEDDSLTAKYLTPKKDATSTMPKLDFELPSSTTMMFGDLASEMDRVFEKPKPKYLVRQNSSVIHASSSVRVPRQQAHRKNDSIMVEPWQGSTPQKAQASAASQKVSQTTASRAVAKTSAVQSLLKPEDAVRPKEVAPPTPVKDAAPKQVRRGKLLFKILEIKDVELPMGGTIERPQFACTVDNGKHQVTTPWHVLQRRVALNQEFELLVDGDLEFTVSLHMNMSQVSRPRLTHPSTSPTRPKSFLGKILRSPKKGKEDPYQPSVYESMVSGNGNFARTHVSFDQYENAAYGQAYTTEVALQNFWAVDTSTVQSSMRSGRSSPVKETPRIKKKAYPVCKAVIQMFYAPGTGTSKDPLPNSMKSALRQVAEEEAWQTQLHWEGYLTQQGGDIAHWRRRYFRIEGYEMSAYHETNIKHRRAKFNLRKALKLVGDRMSLTQPEVKGAGRARRKSGFTSDEGGIMYADRGFRLFFKNGEAIDFYADTEEEKEGAMKSLAEVIGHEEKGWVMKVLEKHGKLPGVKPATSA
ncbi:hypothetical protein G7K_2978-t1 [Saitoella complicata NRRL Y-17804]|uniref:PH domain-containing protein n=3 Tax=Saitoella complicata (strain BCRC 22490 / CBS 7301 / JCM 7358 / NBRC 10748 / NRRL Y-17804) TaxID=698492 RepID=A0A0E9NG38_SAICN|nr:hypothetical protein G7K_2978-t1 [Saitoella complicata NRRL Y-17804]